MTNEEAIFIIEHRDSIMDYCESKQLGEALDMAIAALKAEPCEDCVNREGVLKCLSISTFKKMAKLSPEGYIAEYRKRIKALPPVTPKQRTGKWIRHTRVENVYDIAGVKTWGIKHQCDQCTFTTIAIEGFGYYDYCPHCGAKMEGESE